MDKDIKEMFREKNRMILIKNLKYDLDKNINSLLETVINIFNLEFSTAIKNIISILEDSGVDNSNKIITDFINGMKFESYNKVEQLLIEKKEILDKCIDDLEFSEEQLNEYYNNVFKTTSDFEKEIKNYFILENSVNSYEVLNNFVLENVEIEKRTLALSRLNDYLSNRLYGKLESKFHMEITLRDNNLINKAKESYLRFQEISSRTIKSSID